MIVSLRHLRPSPWVDGQRFPFPGGPRPRKPGVLAELRISDSRALYLEFFFDQSMENFLRGHVHAFQAWSGQPRILLYDNLAVPCWNVAATRFTFILDCWTCARIIISPLVPVRNEQEIKKDAWNERFSMYASHLGWQNVHHSGRVEPPSPSLA